MTTLKIGTTHTLDLPDWIDASAFDASDLETFTSELRDLQYGGCASGCYMPAVTCHTARETMNEHGDDVLQYLFERYGELPRVPDGESWSGIAVFYLSAAVESWATDAIDNVEERDDVCCDQPNAVTCGKCFEIWCERCDPAPSALCHTCHGRGYSTASLA